VAAQPTAPANTKQVKYAKKSLTIGKKVAVLTNSRKVVTPPAAYIHYTPFTVVCQVKV
jgi:hypothetical protein